MNRKLIVIPLLLLSLAMALAICMQRNREVAPTLLIEEEVEPQPPVAIHSLFNNEESALEEMAAFDKSIAYFMRKWELTGVSFALMRGDSLLYAKGYGYADKEQEIATDVHHSFRIASVSKLITATAIMKLVEQGKLSLSSQVFGEEGILSDSLFLNLRTKQLEKITVEHLLRHTSGISTPAGDPAFANQIVARTLDKKLPLTVDDMVVYATRCRLRDYPGGRYDYSNLGYIVLGKVVSQVAGMPYESYVQDSILAPIGCYDMYIGNNYQADRGANEVKYYEVKEAELVTTCDGSDCLTMRSDGGNNVTLLGAAGGWVATPVELLRLVAAINDCPEKEDILSPESIALMTQSTPMGWASIRGNDWLRSGSMAGTTAFVKRQRDGYTWVFLVNNSAWIGYHFNDKISEYVTRALSRVKQLPSRDLFVVSDTVGGGATSAPLPE